MSTIYSTYSVCCAVRGVVLLFGVVFAICSIYGKCVVVGGFLALNKWFSYLVLFWWLWLVVVDVVCGDDGGYSSCEE